VLDILDSITVTPAVDAEALRKAEEELAAYVAELEPDNDDDDLVEVETDEDADAAEEPAGFWTKIGIDPIKIITGGREYYTLRCYLDDEPVFLGSDGYIDAFGTPRKLATFLAAPEAADTDLAQVSTWDEVTTKANGGELADIEVDDENTYVLHGLTEDIAEGPDAIDPNQLDLAVELLSDAAAWAEDESTEEALRSSTRLGWFISFVLRPDPTRLTPSAPYEEEVTAWRDLLANFEGRLRTH
jgi:hypothetical protein